MPTCGKGGQWVFSLTKTFVYYHPGDSLRAHGWQRVPEGAGRCRDTVCLRSHFHVSATASQKTGSQVGNLEVIQSNRGGTQFPTVLKPSKTILRPSQTILKPSKTIFKPYKTILKPSKTILQPSKTILNHASKQAGGRAGGWTG